MCHYLFVLFCFALAMSGADPVVHVERPGEKLLNCMDGEPPPAPVGNPKCHVCEWANADVVALPCGHVSKQY